MPKAKSVPRVKLSKYLEPANDATRTKADLARRCGLAPSMVSRALEWERDGRDVRVELENGIAARIVVAQPAWRVIVSKPQRGGMR